MTGFSFNPVELSSDGTSLVSGDGTQYPLTPLTVTFAQAVAQLSAAMIGAVWRISDLGGTYWEKSSTGVLRPVNNIAVTHDIAAPVTFAAGTSPRIYAEYLIPAGALSNRFIFYPEPFFTKSGTTDAMTLNIALSATAGSVGTTISQSAAIAFMSAANRRAKDSSFRFQRLSATTVGNGVSSVGAAAGVNLTSGAAFAAITVPSMDSAIYLQIVGTAGGSTDTMQLESCPLTIIGNPNA